MQHKGRCVANLVSGCSLIATSEVAITARRISVCNHRGELHTAGLLLSTVNKHSSAIGRNLGTRDLEHLSSRLCTEWIFKGVHLMKVTIIMTRDSGKLPWKRTFGFNALLFMEATNRKNCKMQKQNGYTYLCIRSLVYWVTTVTVC